MLPPDVQFEARERAKIVAWLMLYRTTIRQSQMSSEAIGQAQAMLGVIIEAIATGDHSDIDVDVQLHDRQAFH